MIGRHHVIVSERVDSADEATERLRVAGDFRAGIGNTDFHAGKFHLLRLTAHTISASAYSTSTLIRVMRVVLICQASPARTYVS